MTLFNEKIKLVRMNKRMTQKEFANFLEIQERAYQYYESGKREPTLQKATDLSDKLNVSLDYLVGRTDDPKRY